MNMDLEILLGITPFKIKHTNTFTTKQVMSHKISNQTRPAFAALATALCSQFFKQASQLLIYDASRELAGLLILTAC